MKYLRTTMILLLIVSLTSVFAGTDEYLEKVNYRGAFGGSNWAAGWSGLSEYGLFALPTAATGEIVTVTDADIQAGSTV